MENKKLVYAEDLFLKLRDDINISGVNLAMVRRHIEDTPAVDAVEVVRCKKCRFYEMGVEYYDGGTKDICRLLKRQTQEDDFCSYGERREGE